MAAPPPAAHSASIIHVDRLIRQGRGVRNAADTGELVDARLDDEQAAFGERGLTKVFQDQAADAAGLRRDAGHGDASRLQETLVTQRHRAGLGSHLGCAQPGAIQRNQASPIINYQRVHFEQGQALPRHYCIERPELAEKIQQDLTLDQRLFAAHAAEKNLAEPVPAKFLERLIGRIHRGRPDEQRLLEFPRPVFCQYAAEAEADDGAATLVPLQADENLAGGFTRHTRLHPFGNQGAQPVELTTDPCGHVPGGRSDGISIEVAECQRAVIGLVPKTPCHSLDNHRLARRKRRIGEVPLIVRKKVPGSFDVGSGEDSVYLMFRDEGVVHR
jgi:hypothetical protein